MNLIRKFRNWRAYRLTVEELGQLSNRQLADMGLRRDDIHSVARRAL